ncbi:MAG: helix-turn-helix domain-containing protein [bacterium]
METYLTVSDLSKSLKVTPVWIYKLVRQKRIPFLHIERCVRFSPSEIEKWLEERKNKEWSLGASPRRQG